MILTDLLPSLAGGVLIGAAAAGLLHLNGRIAGVSGIVAGVFAGDTGVRMQRLLFLLGLVAGAGLYELASGTAPVPRPGFPPLLLAAAGVLVGVGTALARGCTSGHGVCGMARFSRRSFVAVGVFLSVAIGTTWVVRHVWGIA
jgi:hypothetical protein